MRLNNAAIRAVSVILCIVLVFTVFGAYTPQTRAETLSGLQNEQSQLKDKIKESEKKVADLEKQQNQQENVINELNDQINRLNAQLSNVHAQQSIINDDIRNAEAEIAALNGEIAELDVQIAEKDDEIADTVVLFCKRMKANYVAGNTSVLEIFTKSTTIPNFLNRIEMFKRVTESDQELVDKLHEEISAIEKMQDDLRKKKSKLLQDKTVLETRRNELRSTENELDATQAEIIAKSNEVNKKLASLNYQTKKLEVSIEKYNADMDRIDKEIQNFLKRNSSKGKSSKPIDGGSASSNISSSGWAWPLPYSNTYVSSPYGYRSDPISGAYKFHGGMDISMGGAYGKKIVASKAGTVLTATYHNSYGNYVLIDHGNGWASLYAHCSAFAVSAGQTVKQGQVISYVGTTGYSTGPHVHFEIRYNGERINPANYVSRG